MNACECNASEVKKVSFNLPDVDNLVSFIIEEGFDIEKVIEQLEDYLAEIEEVWSDEELDYEVDENGFHSLI